MPANRYRGPPMTLANMRAQGVRSLWAVCDLCHHEASNVLRCLTLYQVHAHDAATGHNLSCDWRLTVYERILLARAREVRYQSAREDVVACDLGGLINDVGNFGQWKWIIVREIDG